MRVAEKHFHEVIIFKDMDGHGKEKCYTCSKYSKKFSQMDSKKRQEVSYTNEQPSSSGGTLRLTSPQTHYQHHQRTPNKFKVIKSVKTFSNATVTWTLKYRRNDVDACMGLLVSSYGEIYTALSYKTTCSQV